MSELVNKYIELSKKGFDAKSEEEADKIADEMTDVEKKFKDSDWDELIGSVPAYMKPLLLKQKSKYIK